MINALGVLGWGVGGLEAEGAMFGLPLALRLPEVVGVRLTGALGPGRLGTDAALTVTERLRKLGVVGKFVEFFGPGVAALSVGERGAIANMAPEYGATTGFFPLDAPRSRLSAGYWSRHGPAARYRGLRPTPGLLARPRRNAALRDRHRSRPERRRAFARRAEATAGPGGAGTHGTRDARAD